MNSPQDRAQDAREELTPEALAVIGRARRSFGISIAILLVGLITIAGVLVYRATRDSGAPAVPGGQYLLGEIALPAGAEVVSIVPGEGMIAVTYRLGGVVQLRLIDGQSGAVIRDISSRAE